MELAQKIKEKQPVYSPDKVWKAIRDNDIKTNPDYSAYNFRNKKQEDDYKETGDVPSVTPNIYNHKAVDFIVNLLKSENV